ncbi:MAG TPA: aldehyde ferredoxin oxidoreductase, partial [Anaerolineae bacterium]|nr:aldehyde ferredoxin oxidoreductase [Anaerolineae bacterium]
GYAGKFLWVDLITGEMQEEVPDEALLCDFIGGYGIGARILYDRMLPGVDPLGPENILGFITGPLTGTAAPTGTRWTVVGKSPLTGGWGDANGSGFFGVALKQAGYDAVFFTGIAQKPVYLYIEDGRAELRDAGHLWGMDTYQLDDWVKAEFGRQAEVACIGPAGERLSLISAVVHAKGRAAARSGVGAIMGSKRLKAVVAKGSKPIPMADPVATQAARRKYSRQITSGVGFANYYRTTGTPGYTLTGLQNGDSPVKNWGASIEAFPDPSPFEFEVLLKYRKKRQACWHCPIACWGTVTFPEDEQTIEAHQPEYETSSAFGSMTLNNDLVSIMKSNDLCNRYGLDTISAGATVAFAIECYENGLITAKDTGGIELTWGNADAIVAITEKLALREGFGDILADGVKRAAEKIGSAAEPFAIHEGGQELPMHDPRFEPALVVIYRMDPTPGRHTQACQYFVAEGFETDMPLFGTNPEKQKGRGRYVKPAGNLMHVVNTAGICLFGYLSTRVEFIPELLSVVTGRSFTLDDMLLIGERIANMRQAFNVREGLNPLTNPLPKRAYGMPPLPDGPTAGITVQVDQLIQEFLEEMDWTPGAAVPRARKLIELGLDDVARDLWPEES